VTLCDPELPVVTFPKARVDGETAIAGAAAAAPVPDMLTIVLDVEALLEIAMLPVEALVVVGANLTLKFADDPAAIVAGMPMPLTEYPVPLTDAELTVKLAVPVFWTETVCVADWPTVTLPNERLAGETAIAGEGAGCPVPLNATVEGDVGASLVMEMLPELLPVVVGA
jgi:hypothetical protein